MRIAGEGLEETGKASTGTIIDARGGDETKKENGEKKK